MKHTLFVIVVICKLTWGETRINVSKFREVFSCVATDDVFDSAIVTVGVHSLIKCSTLCSEHGDCEAFQISRLAPFTCILHSRTLQSQSCLEYPDISLRGFNNVNAQCLNGGSKQGSGCQCYYGYLGPKCERIQRDCNEGYNSVHYSPTTSRHILLIQPSGAASPFLAKCWFTNWGSGRTYLMQRIEGDVDFNRPWDDYKNGFGDMNSDYWLGLDKMHHVTNDNGDQRVVMEVQALPEATYRQCIYYGFRVNNETDGYAFDFDYYTCRTGQNHLEDCLTPMKGKRFTTLDVDNDDLGGNNCAQIHQGAWWFTGCGDCNPTGPMVKPPSRLFIPNEAFWNPGIPNCTLIKIEMFMH